MNKTVRKVCSLAAGLAASATMLVALPAQAAPVTDSIPPASAKKVEPPWSHNLVVVHDKKGKTGGIDVCNHWESAEVSTYRCDGDQFRLLRGQDSRKDLHQKDIDAILQPTGWVVKENVVGPDPALRPCHRVTRWIKVSPYPWDHKRNFYLKSCQVYKDK